MTRIRVHYRPAPGSSGPTILAGLACYVLLWIAVGCILASLFQYVLWSLIARDIPWYADLIGGVACNGFILAAAGTCWIARLCGFEAPFLHP